jgi:uncharacterized cupin superfamily protein
VAARLFFGVQCCEPGYWYIEIVEAEHELFTVLTGCRRVHAEDDTFAEARPGEAITIPAGFRSSLGVIEGLTKTYAIVSTG